MVAIGIRLRLPGSTAGKNCLGKKGASASRAIPISRKSDVSLNRESYRADQRLSLRNNRGLRGRLETLATGYDTLLLPGIRAEILGLLDRLDLVCGELKKVEAEKVARLTASKATAEAHGATAAMTQDPEAGEVASASDELSGSVPKHAHCAATMVRLRGIGINDALLLRQDRYS